MLAVSYNGSLLVLFPFHSRPVEMSGRVKYIHITCVIIGILIPFVPIITSMSKFAMGVNPFTGEFFGFAFKFFLINQSGKKVHSNHIFYNR